MIEKPFIDSIKLQNEKVTMETDTRGKCRIILPFLSNDELLARANRIKAIINDKDAFYMLNGLDLKDLKDESLLLQSENKRKIVDMLDYETIGEFFCFHPFPNGEYSFFKPTIAQVLAQFPYDIVNLANAFYMYGWPTATFEIHPEYGCEISNFDDIIDADCHISKVKALVLKK